MPAYQKVLVVLDLSADSEQVAVAARDIAAHSQGQIILLHVVEFVPVEPMGEALMPSVQIEEDLIERSKDKMQDLATRLMLGATTQLVKAGNIKAEILSVAKDYAADLIVVGSRERHGLAILVNFTEDTVLHAAHCDVLAVRLK
jgi:universal stress protein A